MSIMIQKECLVCKNKFEVYPYRKDIAKFCSHKCYGLQKIGSIVSNYTKVKMSLMRKGKKHLKKHIFKNKVGEKTIQLECLCCKNKFRVHICREKTAKFCSIKCWSQYSRVEIKCKQCNKNYWDYRSSKSKFCSNICFREFNKAENHYHWREGKTKNWSGYIYVFNPKHPFAESHGYVREHRLVMEKHLGRYLQPIELIHHLNGIKDDNRIENLLLNGNSTGHQAVHHAMEQFVYKLIQEGKVYYDIKTKEFNLAATVIEEVRNENMPHNE